LRCDLVTASWTCCGSRSLCQRRLDPMQLDSAALPAPIRVYAPKLHPADSLGPRPSGAVRRAPSQPRRDRAPPAPGPIHRRTAASCPIQDGRRWRRRGCIRSPCGKRSRPPPRCPCRGSASRRCATGQSGSRPIGRRPGPTGRPPGSSSRPSRARRSTPHGTSTGALTSGAGRRAFGGSRSTTPDTRAPPCSPRWTSIPGSPCASCGTRRSTSRWRSTRRSPTPTPSKR
jgi:hypothetical protein